MTSPLGRLPSHVSARPLASPRSAYPVAPAAIPELDVLAGRYRLRFARTRAELDAVLRLRFEVFNLELGEGLEASYATGRDEDPLDSTFHHLMITEAATERVVGTYRMQTAAMAAAGGGFYSATEFDLSDAPAEMLEGAVEVGRACVAGEHRNGRVIHLLWRGLAAYLQWNRKRWLFGCCSLATQEPGLGHAVHRWLSDGGHLHDGVRVWPRPGLECGPADAADPSEAAAQIPALLRGYLDLGAAVCGPPAIDRLFGTIDFFVLLDTETLDARTRRSFFR